MIDIVNYAYQEEGAILRLSEKSDDDSDRIFLVNRSAVYDENHNVIAGVAQVKFRLQTLDSAKKLMRKYSEYEFYREEYRSRNSSQYSFDKIVGNSPRFAEVKKAGYKAAKTMFPVLLTGETGTGKEVFANAIHNNGEQREKPMVSINCAAIPETLLESELFGYEGGSFTGARREGKEGLIELAHQGTLFLDEIGELPLPIQSRLLRVLQEYEIMRVGGKDIIPVDVRIIGATNRSLEKMAEEGSFRGDLYYRLNVLPLMVPPLREREGDVRFLAEHFLEKSGCGHKLAQFIALFSTYNWPGNVRELNFIIERLALLSAGFPNASLFEILNLTGFNALKSCNTSQTNGRIVADLSKGQLKAVIKDLERQIIAFYMDLFEQDQEKVAAHLGISKMSLWRKYNQMDR